MNSQRPGRDVLIVGIGNEFRGDDAAGLLVVRELRKKSLPEVEVLEHSGEGASLLELYQERKMVILVDAVQSDLPVGRIVRFDAAKEPVPSRFFHYSTHDFGLAESVEMARALGKLPPNLIIYGIAGKQFSLGDTPSAPVLEAVSRVVENIQEEIHQWFLD